MATLKLRVCFGVLCLFFLLTAGAVQAAPEPSESPAGFFATVLEWLRAQLPTSTADEPTDELGGYWCPGGVAGEAPEGGAASSPASEPTDDSEASGNWIPGG